METVRVSETLVSTYDSTWPYLVGKLVFSYRAMVHI
jgi:hypothetical protein